MTTATVPLKLRSVGVGALIAVCLYVSGLLVILTPLPLVYVSATAGRKNGIAAAVLSFTLVVALYVIAFLAAPNNDVAALSIPLPGLGLVTHFSALSVKLFGGGYFLFFLVVALVLAEAVRHHWGLIRGGTRALIAGLALALLVAMVVEFAGATHVIAAMRGYLEFMVAEIAKLQQTAGVANSQTILLQEHGPEVASFVFNIIPSLVFVFALVAVVVNLLFSRRFIRMPHLFSGHTWDVAAFRISDYYVWVVIGAAAVFFAGRYLVKNGPLEYAGINILIAMGAVYFFQGLALTSYFLRRVRFPLLKIGAYIFIILFFQSVGLVIMGLGLADVWVDFRRRSQRVQHE